MTKKKLFRHETAFFYRVKPYISDRIADTIKSIFQLTTQFLHLLKIVVHRF